MLACFSTIALGLQVFAPGAFIIRRQIGQLGFATETEWEYKRDGAPVPANPLDPSMVKRTTEASGNVVRLFDAKLDDGTRILLKEFIGDCAEIGANEAAIYNAIYERSIGAGNVQPPQQLGTLLGTMKADSSFSSEAFRRDWANALGESTLPPSSTGLWLCFRWEGLSTVAGFAKQPQQRAWFDLDGRGSLSQRRIFVKTAAKRILETVGWLHGQGIVHRSLGSSSLLLNTWDQTVQPAQLQVKAIDLGFATTAASISSEDVTAAMARGADSPLTVIPFLTRADDLHALAYVILELVLGSANPPPEAPGAVNGAGPPTDMQSLKRLVEDVFASDVCGQFREYCMEEAAWAPAVALLDEAGGAGWRLVQQLVECRDANSEEAEGASCQRLLTSPWFAE